MRTALFAVVMLPLIYSLPALAHNEGTLPKGAVPLTAAETKGIYVGNTVTYNIEGGKVYSTFTPSGKLLGFSDGKHTADGTWSVSGNKFCFNSLWRDTSGKPGTKYAPCKAWWKSGCEMWTKTVSGEEPRYMGDIYNNQIGKISKGDKVSERLAVLKAAAK